MNRESLWKLSLRSQSLNPESRTVDAVASTEDPVPTIDWDRLEVNDEVLLASGAKHGGRAPLLDSHQRTGVTNVIGSFENIRTENRQLVGTLRLANTEEGTKALELIRDGHLTDVSVGYNVEAMTRVEASKSVAFEGKEFKGPLRVVTQWSLRELSLVPIGADPNAKLREYQNLIPATIDLIPQGGNVRMDPTNPNPSPDPVKGERERQKAIRAMAQEWGYAAVDGLIDAGDSVHEAERKILADFKARQTAHKLPAGMTPSPEITRDERETRYDSLVDGILLRAGSLDRVMEHAGLSEKEKRERRQLAQMGRRHRFIDLARELVGNKAMRNWDAQDVFQAAMAKGSRAPLRISPTSERTLNHTSSDFPNILADAAFKVLAAEYALAEVTWNRWCAVGTFSDFKPKNINQLSESAEPQLILENGEVPRATFSEKKESYDLDTFGKIISISRKTLINDDLDAFSRIPTKIANGFARKVNKIAYEILRNPPTLNETGLALFHATHGNLDTGGSSALSNSALNAAFKKFMEQKALGSTSADPTFLNIRPSYLIVPPALAATAFALVNSSTEYGQNNPNVKNRYQGMLEVVEDAMIGAAAGTTTDTNWFLAAAPGAIDTVEVGFLDGVNAPTVVEEQSFDVLGMELRSILDVAAAALDYRGLYKSAGA